MKTNKTSLPVFEADSHILNAGDMRPKYDFSQGVRGKHTKDLSKGYTSIVTHPDGTKEITHYRPLPDMIHLASDVKRYFPDSDAVNTALRGLIALIPAKRRAARAARQQAKEGAVQ